MCGWGDAGVVGRRQRTGGGVGLAGYFLKQQPSKMYAADGVLSLSSEAVLAAARAGGRRPAIAVGGTVQEQQNIKVRQELHSQTVRLRESFLRQDRRITGSVPKYLLATCLRAGGLELDQSQAREATWKYTTGNGRFNWMLFCDDIEKARSKSWSQASRIKSAKAFAEIDRDGSGRLSRDELESALVKWNLPVDQPKLDALITACDARLSPHYDCALSFSLRCVPCVCPVCVAQMRCRW